VSGEPARPALQLLNSLLVEERVGRPGPARERALASADEDAANRHVHLLDAAYCALVAGEPRAANRVLAACEVAAPAEDAWRRRIGSARVWSWAVDLCWYPGDAAAEVVSYDLPAFPEEREGDPETRLLEAIANDMHMLRSFRVQVETQVRQNPENALALVGAAAQSLQRLEAAVQGVGAASSSLLFSLAFSDLLQRAGKHEDAATILAEVRRQHRDLAAAGIVNPVGLACTFLVEGDWYATPGSSPEALGFDLATLIGPSPFLDRRDLGRAAAAYDEAAALLANVDEPRAHGALALRRGALAWLSGDHAAQRGFLATAAETFGAAGDAAALRLVGAHELLVDVALGAVAATRRKAGTGFDLEPRGPVADTRRWAESDGSAGWATGLGRLFQRAAERWDVEGDYERAAVAYELAIPLLPLSGAESPATAVLALASLDRRSGFLVRALTRCRTAIATLPPVSDAVREMLDWTRSVNALLDVGLGQLDASATAAGMSVPTLDWANARVRELLELPGVPAPEPGREFDLADVQRRAAARTLEELQAEAANDAQAAQLELLAGVADTARELVALNDAMASFQRGRQAAAIGATATADRWYSDALGKVEALPPDAAPHAVIILAARDRFDEAQARLRKLAADPEQRRDLLAAAAVRARDYETALRLFGTEPEAALPWTDVLDHADAALGAGRTDLALSLADRAVRDFEARFARLRRDVDRIAVADDVKIAALYLVAARTQLAAEATAPAFAFSDRARALTLDALIADASDDTDDERLVLAWRRATSEWQGAHDRLQRAFAGEGDDGEIAAGVDCLAAAERGLVEVEAELERVGRRPQRVARHEPPGLGDVQAALPEDAVLLEYQLVGRDLLVWMVTRRTAAATESRYRFGELARLGKAVQRSCANGLPGPEAAELAALLLEPAAHVLSGTRRAIVVPYGPLHGVPFHVLPVDGHALGETHVVSYLPAAALLLRAGPDEPIAARRALVVGDPAFDAAAHPSLARLPGAEVEARSVAETYGVPALIGPDAAEGAIRRELGRCDLVHLAAHARLDHVAPSASSLVLADRDELTVSDLVGLRIDSELAVLSACDSGRGAASLGGDVVGLVRGLIAAGARRSVVSLWPVDDAPACVTMSLFHEQLAGGRPPADALHAAQTAVRGMAGADLAARYAELGGDPAGTASVRRGAPSEQAEPELPLDPEFVDDLADAEPVDALRGEQARVWAPFVLVGA
jgi:CHAT domain-containing protein/tetratricopeptide (TPR) repeat protein